MLNPNIRVFEEGRGNRIVPAYTIPSGLTAEAFGEYLTKIQAGEVPADLSLHIQEVAE